MLKITALVAACSLVLAVSHWRLTDPGMGGMAKVYAFAIDGTGINPRHISAVSKDGLFISTILEDGVVSRVLHRNQTESNGLATRGKTVSHRSGSGIILLDSSPFLPGGGIHPESQSVKTEAKKLIKTLSQEDNTLIFSTRNDTLNTIRDFTNEERLGTTVEQASPAELRKALTVFDVSQVSHGRTVQIHVSSLQSAALNLLEALADHVAPIPGRKSLIWLCQNPSLGRVPPEGSPLHLDWVSAMTALQRSNISAYTIACSGVGLPAAGNIPLTASGLPDPAQGGTIQGSSRRLSQKQLREDGEALATMTGGRNYAGPQSLRSAYQQALQDNKNSVEIEWLPTAEAPSLVHSIQIESSASLLYPHSYFTPKFPMDLVHRLRALETAFATPLSLRALDVKVTSVLHSGSADFVLRLNPTKIEFVHGMRSESRTALLDVIYAFYDSSGNRLKQGTRNELNFEVEDADWDTFLREPKEIKQTIVFGRPVHSIKIGIRDTRTGAIFAENFVLDDGPTIK